MLATLFFNKPVSGAFSGTFLGDGSGVTGVISSSYAQNSTTASYALTASFVQGGIVQSASYAIFASSSGFAANATSASNALTASYAQVAETARQASTASFVSANNVGAGTFNGNYSMSGDLNVAGTITATTLVVQTITSSVSYITGSTRFGNSLQNTHEFTGSVLVTGSVTASGFSGNGAGITGVITASFAQNAFSSSYALSASFVPTSSYTINALTASYVEGGTVESASYAAFAQNSGFATSAVSSSYALTASYAANVPEIATSASFAQTASYARFAASAPQSLNLNNVFGAVINLTNIDSPITEQDIGERQAIDLTNYNEARVVAHIVSGSANAGNLRVEYSTNAVTWAALDGVTGPQASLVTSGTIRSPWVVLTGGARTDAIVRWVTANGNGAAGAQVGSITLQVR